MKTQIIQNFHEGLFQILRQNYAAALNGFRGDLEEDVYRDMLSAYVAFVDAKTFDKLPEKMQGYVIEMAEALITSAASETEELKENSDAMNAFVAQLKTHVAETLRIADDSNVHVVVSVQVTPPGLPHEKSNGKFD